MFLSLWRHLSCHPHRASQRGKDQLCQDLRTRLAETLQSVLRKRELQCAESVYTCTAGSFLKTTVSTEQSVWTFRHRQVLLLQLVSWSGSKVSASDKMIHVERYLH